MSLNLGPFSLDRMVQAVENVRNRLLRSTAALAAAGVPYAVAGGNAVAAWVSLVDTAAVRNTQDVDILLRREDLERAKVALEAAGFVYRHTAGVDVFLDGANAKAREGVHIVFAGEKVRPHELAANPDVDESEDDADFRVLTLDALVRLLLSLFTNEARMLLRDLSDVHLIGEGWLSKLSAELAERLRLLLDDPNG